MRGPVNTDGMRLHAATKIVLWIVVAALVGRFRVAELLGLSVAVAWGGVLRARPAFSRLIRRTRILFLSILLIDGLTLPGVALYSPLGRWSPTVQGLEVGAMQVWRLALLLGALAWMLATAGKEDLLRGLYVLLRPLEWVGVHPRRLMVRIWLTWVYAEELARFRVKDWRLMSQALQRLRGSLQAVALEPGRMGGMDAVALTAALCLGGWFLR